ncbi:MAG: hydrogenase iron-sulfur subunit [Dehalococcoidia bacterium]|nr:MAG: hydrogenase iron-sulfur subunit [Dehalococcoidia bacterium]
MVTRCNPGDWHHMSGDLKALPRLMLLQDMLPQLRIRSGRLGLEWISAAEE